ncbi:MAG TPA: hypothetical protein VL326_18220 [Kofleriaceae bacterium]|jgi:hypothetical protein|nr:hypothetical protein [Kofleriaceae bacterium]
MSELRDCLVGARDAMRRDDAFMTWARGAYELFVGQFIQIR